MKIRILVLSLLAALGVSACGGGGSGSTLSGSTASNSLTPYVVSTTSTTNSANTSGITNAGSTATVLTGAGAGSSTATANSVLNAEGLWQGSTDNGRSVTVLLLSSGFYWMLYSPAGSNASVAGVVVGNSLSSNGKITSSNGKDFNFETSALMPLTWTGSYTAQSSLQASLTYTDIPSGIIALNTTHDGRYNLTPSLAAIRGTYSGTSTSLANGSRDTTLVIYEAGQLSGSRTDGCTFTGNVSPTVRGNAYNVSIDYGVNCSERNSGRSTNSKGSAYLNPANNRLFSVTLNSSVNDVLFFIGNKQ
ncbi:hypothetical protein J9253_13940 [Thiothrix litoralis]|jgi:hypothetical protein|uniref:Uncharacterized protein n=1 Tax=Thiothrix litoralis TaxID=2891210 RepID=A0ABX7WMW5_9GAMM|nr:hypothetical protein [Thiothrix litoralis]QTR45099.1 hypothetical protein J9253_13940 [Thiothrix litoralis]